MKIHSWQRALAAVVAVAYLITGCTSLQSVPLNPGGDGHAKPSVQVGEAVTIHTRAGETRKFTITAIEDDALVGRNVRVPYSEMASLDVTRARAGGMKTALIVGAVILGAGAIAAASGGGGGSGSGY